MISPALSSCDAVTNPTRIQVVQQSHDGVAGGMLSALTDSMHDNVTVFMAPSDRYSSGVASQTPGSLLVPPLVPAKSS